MSAKDALIVCYSTTQGGCRGGGAPGPRSAGRLWIGGRDRWQSSLMAKEVRRVNTTMPATARDWVRKASPNAREPN